MDDEELYLRQRAQTEYQMAQKSSCPYATIVHTNLAERYLVALSEQRQKNVDEDSGSYAPRHQG